MDADENRETFFVPRGNITGKGRPQIIISDSQLLLMYNEGFSARGIGAIFGCSKSVIYKLYYERGLKFRNRYSNMNREELTAVIRYLHEEHPNSGTEMAPRATTAQYKLLIEMIEGMDEIRYGKGTPEVKKEAWAKISEHLNSLGGATKSGDGWRKVPSKE